MEGIFIFIVLTLKILTKPVVWSNNTAEHFAEAYEMTNVTGVIQDGVNSIGAKLTVNVPVEVFPENVVYFIDTVKETPDENATTESYEAIKKLRGDALLNQAEDQLTLEAGEYTITSAHREWWAMTRPMKITVKAGDEELATSEIQVDASHVTVQNTCTVVLKEKQTISYDITATGTEAPVISWLAVSKKEDKKRILRRHRNPVRHRDLRQLLLPAQNRLRL